jgi:hypothetical protein
MADAKEEWKYHPLREFLRLELINGLLELDNNVGPVAVWNKYCDVRPDLFEGMSCDQLFATRLRGLRSQTQRDVNRADDDEDAFFIHRQNYPYQSHDIFGRPNWYGSEAEKLLEQDMALHPTLKPKELHATRQEYMEFSLDVFRSHIHQVLETKKYRHTLKTRDAEMKAARERERKKKIQKREEAAKKKKAAAKKKEEAAEKKEAAAWKKEEAAKKKAEKKEAAAKKKEEAAKKKAEKEEAAAKKKEAAAEKKEAAAKKKEAAAAAK